VHKQSGVSKVALAGLLAAVAIGAGGFLAWQKIAEIDRLQNELKAARTDADKMRIDVRKAAQDVANANKEAAAFKVMSERLTAERDAVRTSLETAQAAGEQLRGELALAKDQVSYLSARAPKEVVRGMPKGPR
jgi:chromosome segregation ATPase